LRSLDEDKDEDEDEDGDGDGEWDLIDFDKKIS